MSYSRKTILSSLIWKFLERIGSQAVSFIVTIVLARLLTPDEYGTVALILIFVALAEVIAEGGLNTALVQKKNSDDVDFSTIFYFSLFFSILLYSLLFALAPTIAKFYNNPNLISAIRVLSLSIIFFVVNSIQRAYVSKEMLFNKLFRCTLLSNLLSGFAGVLLAYKGYGLWALVYQALLAQVFNCLFMWFSVKWRPILAFSYQRFKALFSFGWKIFATNFIVTLFTRIRTMVVGKIFSPTILAYFDKGAQFPDLIMNTINSSVQSVILPAFSAEQDDRYRVKQMMRRSTQMTCYCIYPLMMGLICVAEPLVRFLLTEKWLPCSVFIQILCIANFFRPITTSNIEAIKSLGYSNITLKLELIKKIVDVAILTLSCFLGIKAIAWGIVVYNFISVFINIYPNIKLLDYSIKEQFNDILPILFITICMGICIYWINIFALSPFIKILAQTVLGVIVYLVLSKIFRIESYNYVVNLLKKKKK